MTKFRHFPPLPTPLGLFRMAIKAPWGVWHLSWRQLKFCIFLVGFEHTKLPNRKKYEKNGLGLIGIWSRDLLRAKWISYHCATEAMNNLRKFEKKKFECARNDLSFVTKAILGSDLEFLSLIQISLVKYENFCFICFSMYVYSLKIITEVCWIFFRLKILLWTVCLELLGIKGHVVLY